MTFHPSPEYRYSPAGARDLIRDTMRGPGTPDGPACGEGEEYAQRYYVRGLMSGALNG